MPAEPVPVLSDQQSTWMAFGPEGAASGWGGRLGDLFMSANGYPVFTAISTSGNTVYLAGQQTALNRCGSGVVE